MCLIIYVTLAVGRLIKCYSSGPDIDIKPKMSFPVIPAVSVGNMYLWLKPGVRCNKNIF